MSHERVLVGQIGAAHGLKGEVRLKSFTEDPLAIADYGPLEIEGGARPLSIQSVRRSKTALIARLEGVRSRSEAEALKGRRLYVSRAQLPELEAGVYYQADLLGLEVRAGEKKLGWVAQVVNFGGGDLLEVEGEGGDRLLVPLTGAEVDLTKREIAVELAEGFLEEE
ncbi:MAG TPA: ribosome maturation factor RimM [Aestuariivirgaceae bacterium]